MSLRYDIAELPSPEITASGFLRVGAHPTRAGILIYTLPDGTVRRELRPEDEVFNADSLDTLAGAPVTEGHVGLVGPDTVRSVRVGTVVGSPSRDGQRVRAKLQIDDPRLMSDVVAKKYTELSCGYRCQYEPTPGTWKGQRYDGIQRKIRYDHVALCLPGTGRAGAECAMRLDSTDTDVLTAVVAHEEQKSMDIEQLTAKVAELEAALAASVAKSSELEASAKSEKERADSLLADVTKRDRKDLEASVLGVLPKFDCKDKDDSALRLAVIAERLPNVRMDNTSVEYQRAMFDAALSVRLDNKSAPERKTTTENPNPGQVDARAAMLARNAAKFSKGNK